MLVAAFVAAVLTLLSIRAHQMLPHADRLPMQFSLTGHAGWSAPRMVALAFLPALAFVTMLGVGFIPAQQGLREAQGISAVSFILGHLFYLWLLRRHLR